MKASDISIIINPIQANLPVPDAEIVYLLTDSRRMVKPQGTLFFAIPTQRNTGCRYIGELYGAGVRSFVVPSDCGELDCPDANVWRVDNVVEALQRIASYHRNLFDIPVVGITGSNGKTIVKDWIVQLLAPDYSVIASPKSYNSQIGVPLSVWQMGNTHDIAVFEAGISQPGEMEALQRVIKPSIGIFTNLGSAHDENFSSREQKLEEKMKLFSQCDTVIYCADDIRPEKKVFSWGYGADCDLQVVDCEEHENQTTLTLEPHIGRIAPFMVTIPFVGHAACENAMHCITLMLYMGYRPDQIAGRCAQLAPVEMRLELNKGVGNCLLINDSYSLDLNSLKIALEYMERDHRQFRHRTLIMSDILQAGVDDRQLYAQVVQLMEGRMLTRFIGIGTAVSRCADLFSHFDSEFYSSTEEFLAHCDITSFRNDTILIKGARVFGFERIVKFLQYESHETVMEVNLDAMVRNLNYFRSRLRPQTKLMAMVKASSYGAGTVEVANTLQFNHVDYLTVAYIDEGVELRSNGITLPIMVMNPEPSGFDDMVRYRLEPDIYSFRILDKFTPYLEPFRRQKPYPIHIEFDTGMHRLGFVEADVEPLRRRLGELADRIDVRSVFTHLACSEDASMDAFTQLQISRFRKWSEGLPGIKHILNSSGISRFPEAQMDMVRLGIGLYGVAPEPEVQCQLKQVSRLVTRISQIKDIPEGDTVGYNCRWRALRPSRIAILTIGYADGLHRGLGNGQGRVRINGHEAPIVGSICMDMCFVDVTDVPCAEGDRAVIFGEGDLLQRNAAAAGTIPYELLTAVSPRVKRVYYHEE